MLQDIEAFIKLRKNLRVIITLPQAREAWCSNLRLTNIYAFKFAL